MQSTLKKKGGLIASFCNAGQEEGMVLTRAAFAVMLKFAGLTASFTSIMDSIEMEQMSNKVFMEPGPDQISAVAGLISSAQKGDEVMKCWANATQMRRWLI